MRSSSKLAVDEESVKLYLRVSDKYLSGSKKKKENPIDKRACTNTVWGGMQWDGMQWTQKGVSKVRNEMEIV